MRSASPRSPSAYEARQLAPKTAALLGAATELAASAQELAGAEGATGPGADVVGAVQGLIRLLGGQPGGVAEPKSDREFAPTLESALQSTRAAMRPGFAAPGTLAGANGLGSGLVQQLLVLLEDALLQALGQITHGAPPDYAPVTSTGSLVKQAAAAATTPEGKQAEGAAKPLSPEDQQKLEEQQKADAQARSQADDALAKNDFGKLRAIVGNDKALAALRPDQKASIATALSNEAVSKKEGSNEDRQAITKLLGSARSDGEVRGILEDAGPELVQQAMQNGVKEPRKDSLIAQFDIIAGARGASEYAVVPETAARAEEALERGYPPERIIAAHQNAMDSMGNDDRSKACAEDPLVMLVAIPEEKSHMLRRLIDGWTTDSEDRAMASILESCKDKSEFDEVVDGAGGRAVIDEMDDDEAKKKFNRLAGAYGRMDLVTIPQEAAKTANALVDPQTSQRLLGGATDQIVRPGKAAQTGDPADDFIAQQGATTHARVLTLDRRAAVDTILENAAREKDGKPLIQPQDLRSQVEAVMNDPSLKGDDKNKAVDELRKQAGLDDYTMRNITTQPLARIFEDATRDSSTYAAYGDQALVQGLRQSISLTGPDSDETREALRRLEEFRRKMGVHTQELASISKQIGDMYPPPVSFWEGFVDVLKGIALNFAPMLLNLIPGVGTALYAGFQIAKGIYDAVNGNLLGGLMDVANVLPGLGSAGTIASTAIKAGVGVEQAIEHGDLGAGLGALASAAGGFAGVGGDFGKVAGTAQDVFEGARAGVGIIDAAANGDVAAALGGVGSLAGKFGGSVPAFQQVADYAQRGSQLADAIQHGDLARAFGTAANWVGLDANEPAMRLVQQGAGVLQNVASGNFTGTLNSLSQVLGGFDSPAAREVSTLATQGARFAGALQSGDFTRALSGAAELAQSLGAGPAVEALRSKLQPFEQVLGDLQRGDLLGALASGKVPGAEQLTKILGVVGGAKGFIQSVANGDLAGALRAVGEQASRLSDDPVLRDALGLVRDGTAVVGALSKGRFSEAIDQLGIASRLGVDAGTVRQAEQLVRGLAGGVLGGRVRGDDARALVQGLEKFVRQLGGGQVLGALARYQGQLQQLGRATAAPDFLRGFERQAQAVQSLFDSRSLADALRREIARNAPAPIRPMPVSAFHYGALAA